LEGKRQIGEITGPDGKTREIGGERINWSSKDKLVEYDIFTERRIMGAIQENHFREYLVTVRDKRKMFLFIRLIHAFYS
jgi:hypothetical protein